MKQKAIIFDLDGTLCDITHRLHYLEQKGKDRDYTTFHMACKDDKPVAGVAFMVSSIIQAGEATPIFLTGRLEAARRLTTAWIKEAVPVTRADKKIRGLEPHEYFLYMRLSGDKRPTEQLKREWYKEYIEPEYDVIVVFEDKQACVDMWRELGLLCLQTARTH